MLPAGVLDELKLQGSFNLMMIDKAASWVNTTRHCKYTQVFLMMGKNIGRNM
jgi:hypothetical protein